MKTQSIESTNQAQRVPGIYELAREHLTTLAEEFHSERWLRIVSAWRRAARMDPEDLADSYEGPYGLRLQVIGDIGGRQAEAGSPQGDVPVRGLPAVRRRDGPVSSPQSAGRVAHVWPEQASVGVTRRK